MVPSLDNRCLSYHNPCTWWFDITVKLWIMWAYTNFRKFRLHLIVWSNLLYRLANTWLIQLFLSASLHSDNLYYLQWIWLSPGACFWSLNITRREFNDYFIITRGLLSISLWYICDIISEIIRRNYFNEWTKHIIIIIVEATSAVLPHHRG